MKPRAGGQPETVTLIRSATLYGGVEYAYAATAPASARLIFLAGSCPLDENGATVAPGDAWAVVREAFGDHDVPSTLLGVTVLGYEGQLVEIEAVAAVAG